MSHTYLYAVANKEAILATSMQTYTISIRSISVLHIIPLLLIQNYHTYP